MTLKLYAHPFSSYCQKVLVALYENGTPFEFRMLDPGDESATAELADLWPLKRFPVLLDGAQTRVEATIIIEHLQLFYPGPVRLIPEDASIALDVRADECRFRVRSYVITVVRLFVHDTV